MRRVRCTLLTVGEGDINNLPFRGEAGNLLSDPVSAEVAAGFEGIPGYEIVAAEPRPEAPAAEPLAGDKDGDGVISPAEKRALSRKGKPAAR